jgi:hypothetical protein
VRQTDKVDGDQCEGKTTMDICEVKGYITRVVVE